MAFLSFGFGIFLAIVLVILGRHFQSRPLYAAALGTLLLGIAGYVGLRLFQSEADRVKSVVRELALAVGSNDIARAQTFVSPSAQETFDTMGSEMKRYQFDWCRVSGFDGVEFSPQDPNQATVTFTVWVYVKIGDRETNFTFDGSATQEVRLWMQKEGDGQWRVRGYSHRRPSSGDWPPEPTNGMIGGYLG